MLRMARVVDEQNAADPSYKSMINEGKPSGHAYTAAHDLVTHGTLEPSGYTEPGLHRSRRNIKKGDS
jgi:malate synthase